MQRRQFLSLTAMTAASFAAPRLGFGGDAPAAPPADFAFIFLTDTHLQQELNAAAGMPSIFGKATSHPRTPP